MKIEQKYSFLWVHISPMFRKQPWTKKNSLTKFNLMNILRENLDFLSFAIIIEIHYDKLENYINGSYQYINDSY